MANDQPRPTAPPPGASSGSDAAQAPSRKPAPKATPKRADRRRYVHVYDPRTGVKNPSLVPKAWLRIFPHLRETPTSRKER